MNNFDQYVTWWTQNFFKEKERGEQFLSIGSLRHCFKISKEDAEKLLLLPEIEWPEIKKDLECGKQYT